MMPLRDNGSDTESLEVEYESDSIHSADSNNSEHFTAGHSGADYLLDHMFAEEMTSLGEDLSLLSDVESFYAEPACNFLDSNLMAETPARVLHLRNLRSSIDHSQNALLYPPVLDNTTESSTHRQKVPKTQVAGPDCDSKTTDWETNRSRLVENQCCIQAMYSVIMILISVGVGSVLLLIPLGTTLSFMANSSLALLFATFGMSLLLLILLFATVE